MRAKMFGVVLLALGASLLASGMAMAHNCDNKVCLPSVGGMMGTGPCEGSPPCDPCCHDKVTWPAGCRHCHKTMEVGHDEWYWDCTPDPSSACVVTYWDCECYQPDNRCQCIPTPTPADECMDPAVSKHCH